MFKAPVTVYYNPCCTSCEGSNTNIVHLTSYICKTMVDRLCFIAQEMKWMRRGMIYFFKKYKCKKIFFEEEKNFNWWKSPQKKWWNFLNFFSIFWKMFLNSSLLNRFTLCFQVSRLKLQLWVWKKIYLKNRIFWIFNSCSGDMVEKSF